jgi:hypothetical protein
MTTRRGFLGSILAACAAPAIVRAESLMILPSRKLLLPDTIRIFVNGDELLPYEWHWRSFHPVTFRDAATTIRLRA